MSILIKGMEMPINCFLCPLSVLDENRLFCELTSDEVVRTKIDSDCPLVPVPSHGRLIDADDTENIILVMNENGIGFNRIIAPVIIEAEGVE